MGDTVVAGESKRCFNPFGALRDFKRVEMYIYNPIIQVATYDFDTRGYNNSSGEGYQNLIYVSSF